MMSIRFDVVGVGGGWPTPRNLAFFASSFMPDSTLAIVDGGVYSFDQRDHELFDRPGNKARIQAEWVRREFPELVVIDVPRFVGAKSTEREIAVEEAILDGDVVFLQVDNNKTRRLVLDYVRTLPNATLICGGTNGDQLRVMVYLRRDGRDLTPPFSDYCTEISRPTDRSPAEREVTEGCLERIARAAQQPFTMLSASTFMLNAFYEVWKLEAGGTLEAFPYCELWYDIGTGRCRAELLTPVI